MASKAQKPHMCEISKGMLQNGHDLHGYAKTYRNSLEMGHASYMQRFTYAEPFSSYAVLTQRCPISNPQQIHKNSNQKYTKVVLCCINAPAAEC